MEKTEFQPIPEGQYLVRMSRCSQEPTKNGHPAIKVSYQVIKKVGDSDDNESKTKNRLIFETGLTEHKNPKVAEITRDRMGRYLQAIGVDSGLDAIGGDLSKLSDYLETPFLADIGIEEGTNGYKPTNKVKKFSKR